MNLKAVLIGAVVALVSTVSIGSASAADRLTNINRYSPGLQARGAIAALPAAIVLSNQRYVPVFVGWVNEPYVTFTLVRDPRTGRLARVPVILYNRRLVQVYYDRITGVFFYIGVNGQPLPY